MSLIDKVINFITDELNINIDEENKKLIMKKFYPDIKDKFYWSYEIENTLYEGIINKEEYEKIKKISPNTYIQFDELTKYVYDSCELNDILPFTNDTDKIKMFYDKGGEKCNNYFDLMGYFYDLGKIHYEEEED
jgi:hypothetical protein